MVILVQNAKISIFHVYVYSAVDTRQGQDAQQSQNHSVFTHLLSLEYHRDHRISSSINILCWDFAEKFLVQLKVKEKNSPAAGSIDLFDSRSLSVVLYRSGLVVHMNSICHQYTQISHFTPGFESYWTKLPLRRYPLSLRYKSKGIFTIICKAILSSQCLT